MFSATPITFLFFQRIPEKAMVFQHLYLLQESEPGKDTHEQYTVHYQA